MLIYLLKFIHITIGHILVVNTTNVVPMYVQVSMILVIHQE